MKEKKIKTSKKTPKLGDVEKNDVRAIRRERV